MNGEFDFIFFSLHVVHAFGDWIWNGKKLLGEVSTDSLKGSIRCSCGESLPHTIEPERRLVV
jgi:hypothetical protein